MRRPAHWIVALALLAVGAPVLAAGRPSAGPSRAEGGLRLAPWTGPRVPAGAGAFAVPRSPGVFAAALPLSPSLPGKRQAGVLAADPETWILKNCSDTAPGSGSDLFPGDSHRAASAGPAAVPDLSLPRELAAAPGESPRNLPDLRAAWIGDETATEDTLRLFRALW